MRACLRIENNYFEGVQNHFSYSSNVHQLPTCTLSIPYSYSDALDKTSSIPGIARQDADVGKLPDPASLAVP
jgi:hypothetical protein